MSHHPTPAGSDGGKAAPLRRPLLLCLDEIVGSQQAQGWLWLDTRRPVDYRRGHIPGAINFDCFRHANEATSRSTLPVLAATWMDMFASAGIPLDEPVIFCDAGTENRAPRPAFMLRALGNQRSHVLHGGMNAWLRDGRPIVTWASSRPALPQRAGEARLDPAMVAGVDDVSAAIAAGATVLLDVRDEPEYAGRRRLQWNPRMGRIPGARHLEWTSLLEAESDPDPRAGRPNYGADLLSRFKPKAEIADRLAALGLSPDRPIILYCQKSHRASNVYLALERLGLANLRVYVGSFREWSRRLDLPVERPLRGASEGQPRGRLSSAR